MLVGLTAFLRYTRYGLIIRAGVENRAMVTALGIDVRKAFTLVFALGGAAAALAGVLSGVYYGVVDPGRGTSLLIFAFIVVVIGGFGSIGGTAVAAVVVGLIQQYANYYASSGLGDLAVVLLLAIVLLLRPEGSRRRWRIEARRRDRRAASSSLALLAVVPTAVARHPGRLQRRRSTARARSALLALCLVFAGVALTYDLLFGFTGLLSFGHALYFALGVYVMAIALTKWELALWQAFAARRRRRDRRAARARLGQPAGQRDRLRDGDARVRAGRAGARAEESRTG